MMSAFSSSMVSAWLSGFDCLDSLRLAESESSFVSLENFLRRFPRSHYQWQPMESTSSFSAHYPVLASSLYPQESWCSSGLSFWANWGYFYRQYGLLGFDKPASVSWTPTWAGFLFGTVSLISSSGPSSLEATDSLDLVVSYSRHSS